MKLSHITQCGSLVAVTIIEEVEIDTRHWMNGGVGLTNFSPKMLPVYRRAIEKLGDPNYMVCLEPMVGYEKLDLFCLLRFDIHENPRDAGPFWAAFEEVEKTEFPHLRD